jgi:hypothetical protein
MANPFSLLTPAEQQPKTIKGMVRGVMTFALHLAPANLSGFEVCPRRTSGCSAACLNTAGRGIFDSVQAARIRRTQLYFVDRAAFMAMLAADVAKAIAYAEKRGFIPAFRLNATSDIPWHRVPCNGHKSIMHAFPNVQFYDYTKVAKRLLSEKLPANYHLTFSLAENNDDEARAVLANNGNVAVVYRDKAAVARVIDTDPRVINGDETDLRFLDPRGAIVALYAKGKAKADKSGFVRDTF